jgi:hypothetical protein
MNKSSRGCNLYCLVRPVSPEVGLKELKDIPKKVRIVALNHERRSHSGESRRRPGLSILRYEVSPDAPQGRCAEFAVVPTGTIIHDAVAKTVENIDQHDLRNTLPAWSAPIACE